MKRMIIAAIITATIAPLTLVGQGIEIHGRTGSLRPGDSVDITIPLRSGVQVADVSWRTPSEPWQVIVQHSAARRIPWVIPEGVTSMQLRAEVQSVPAEMRAFPLRRATPNNIFGMPTEHRIITYHVMRPDLMIDIFDGRSGDLLRSMRLDHSAYANPQVVVSRSGHAMLIIDEKRLRRLDLISGLITEDTIKAGAVGYDLQLRTVAYQPDGYSGITVRQYDDSTGKATDLGRINVPFTTSIRVNDTAVYYSRSGSDMHYALLRDLVPRGPDPDPLPYGAYVTGGLMVTKSADTKKLVVVERATGDTVYVTDNPIGFTMPYDWPIYAFGDGRLLALIGTLRVVDYRRQIETIREMTTVAKIACVSALDSTFLLAGDSVITSYRYQDGVISPMGRRFIQLRSYPGAVVQPVNRGLYVISSYGSNPTLLLDTLLQTPEWFSRKHGESGDVSASVAPSGSQCVIIGSLQNSGPPGMVTQYHTARLIDLATGTSSRDITVPAGLRSALWLDHPERPVLVGPNTSAMCVISGDTAKTTYAKTIDRVLRQVREIGIIAMYSDSILLHRHSGSTTRIPMQIGPYRLLDTVIADTGNDAIYVVLRTSDYRIPLQVNDKSSTLHILRLSVRTGRIEDHVLTESLNVRLLRVIGYDRARQRFMCVGQDLLQRTIGVYSTATNGRDASLITVLPPKIELTSALWLPGPGAAIIRGTSAPSYTNRVTYVFDPVTATWEDISEHDIINYIEDGWMVLAAPVAKTRNLRPRPAQGRVDVFDFRCRELFSAGSLVASLPELVLTADEGRSIMGMDSALSWYPWYAGTTIPASSMLSPWYSLITTTDSTITNPDERPRNCCPSYQIRYFNVMGVLLHETLSTSDAPSSAIGRSSQQFPPGLVLYQSACVHGTRRGKQMTP